MSANPYAGFGALTGNVAMTSGSMAGLRAGQKDREAFQQAMLGNMMKVAAAQQDQSNWAAQFNQQSQWRADDNEFRRQMFNVDQAWKERGWDRDNARYAQSMEFKRADEARKNGYLDIQKANLPINRLGQQSAFLEKMLGIPREAQTPFLFPQGFAANARAGSAGERQMSPDKALKYRQAVAELAQAAKEGDPVAIATLGGSAPSEEPSQLWHRIKYVMADLPTNPLAMINLSSKALGDAIYGGTSARDAFTGWNSPEHEQWKNREALRKSVLDARAKKLAGVK